MKLAPKLSLIITLLALIIVTGEGLISYSNSRRIIKEETLNHLASVNLLKESEVVLWIEGGLKDLELLAQRPSLRELTAAYIKSGEIDDNVYTKLHSDHLDIVVRERIVYQALFILNLEDGRIIVSTDKTQEGNYRESEPYFTEGSRHSYIQEVYYLQTGEQPALMISTPLRDFQGKVVAVLAGNLNLEMLSSIVEKSSGLKTTENTYLINRSNFFISEPPLTRGDAFKERAFSDGVEAALSGVSGEGYYDDYRGVPVIGAYRWLPAYNMALITEVEQAEVFAPIYDLVRQTIMMTVSIAFLAALAGWFISVMITRPIRQLAIGIEEIGRGDLDYRIKITGKDEVATLGRAINQMTDKLQATLVSRDLLAENEQKLKKTLSDLERSNKELEQFAYVASHDLQEPLRMISSYTQLLADRYEDVLDEKANKYINYTVDGALRLQRQIGDLLRYSRVETRGAPLELVDSHAILGEAMSNLTAIIEENRAIITNDDLPLVKADPSQLVQVFQNLIDNAVKYRSDKLPHIHIAVEEKESEWLFSVKDNGIGIDEKYRDKVFVIFKRLHTQAEYSGTGIGLALCKRIISRHGGKIWFESETGQGSIFYFTIPK